MPKDQMVRSILTHVHEGSHQVFHRKQHSCQSFYQQHPRMRTVAVICVRLVCGVLLFLSMLSTLRHSNPDVNVLWAPGPRTNMLASFYKHNQSNKLELDPWDRPLVGPCLATSATRSWDPDKGLGDRVQNSLDMRTNSAIGSVHFSLSF